MSDKNLLWKVLFIVVVAGLAFLEMWPVDKRLKGGIDLVGGHSFLYEIDTLGVENVSGLSTRVMEILKQRVDPDGVRNLIWRPVGDTRLQIQMPLPPKQAIEKRTTFLAAMERLEKTNLKYSRLIRVFSLQPQQRSKAIEALVSDMPQREQLLVQAAQAYDIWQEQLEKQTNQQALQDAKEGYEQYLEKLLESNLDLLELNEALDIEASLSERDVALDKITSEHQQRAELIDAVVRAYDQWSEFRGPLDDPADLMRLLKGQGVLEFHILPEVSPENPEEFADYQKRLSEQGPRPSPEHEYVWYELAKPEPFESGLTQKWAGKWWVLAYRKDPLKVLDKSKPDWKLTQASPDRDRTGMPAVGFQFNESGASYFAELTRNNIGKALCIILDGKAFSAPVIQDTIRSRGIINGKFTQEEINYMVSTLNAGSLDARLKENPISSHSIGPSLGQDNRRAGLKAGIYGLVAVLVFMMVYYRKAGLIADLALTMNLLLLMGIMAALEATFTMAGIAGVILTMGMAVDANVLIYERIREESARTQSLRMIIKNGYDRAMSTILDANVTTLITCVVLYYLGTEEIKGFALTLGLGLVISMFTALFVTRVVFTILVKYNIIKSIPMLRLFRQPKIKWLDKQKYFWVLSGVVVITGLILFPLRGSEKYDIEFRGGTAVQIELKSPELLNIAQVRASVRQAGQNLIDSQGPLQMAQLSPNRQSKGSYLLNFQNVSAARISTAMLSFMEDQLEKGSLQIIDAGAVGFRVKSELKLSFDDVQELIQNTARQVGLTGDQLAKSQVQSVGSQGKKFEIVTIATTQHLVIQTLVDVLGKDLNIQPAIKFDRGIKVFPIEDSWLNEVISEPRAPGYVRDSLGGVAFVVDDLDPAITTRQLNDRLLAMRLQPDFENVQWRDSQIIGLTSAAGQDLENTAEEDIKYTRMAVAVADPNYPYDEDRQIWQSDLVDPEYKLLTETLSRATELNKVTQFAPQVAHQAKVSAILALVVACFGIIMYLWIRFGSVRHGLAAVIALSHDVLVCIAFVMAGSYLASTSFGQALGILDFKINLAMVAAFLTVIGYSVNDTIVVYDRIRENRGKLAEISPALIDTSINQTLSRTVLTTFTTLMVMLILFFFGGEGVRGFSYVMIIGSLVGTYSSVAIASPLLLSWTGTLKMAERNRQS